MGAEFWGFVIALCTLGILYFGGEIVREWHREMRPAYRWGERQRVASKEVAWWASHEFCLAITAIFAYVFICWVSP